MYCLCLFTHVLTAQFFSRFTFYVEWDKVVTAEKYFKFFVHSHWSPTLLPPCVLWLVQPNCWWDAERQDCVPCRCSPHGSISQRCDVEGRCICRPGFVGRRCDLRRQGYERRETRRPVERIPMEAAQQRWGGLSRTGGCPRGAYRPKTGVTHACGQRCVLSSMGVFLFTSCAKMLQMARPGGALIFKTHSTCVTSSTVNALKDVVVLFIFFYICHEFL